MDTKVKTYFTPVVKRSKNITIIPKAKIHVFKFFTVHYAPGDIV